MINNKVNNINIKIQKIWKINIQIDIKIVK